MPSFPLLTSGAVTQYPAVFTTGQTVNVIRFLDNSDQRYLGQGRSFRQWQIRLDLLNDSEIAQLEAFFDSQEGDYAAFIFPDPISGANVPNCRLASPAFASAHTGVDIGSASLVVIETNG